VIRIELSEIRPATVALTHDQGRRLAASDLVRATPSRYDPGMWTVSVHRRVGAIRIGDVEVWIAPKLPIDRVLFLAGYAKHQHGWQDETVTLGLGEELVPAVAQMLWRQTERALRQGVLQGYRTVDECSYVLRGRLRETDQLRQHYGQAMPMEIRHNDFTMDVPENQILLASITRMLTVPRVDAESRRHLTSLRERMAPATTLVHGPNLPTWQPTRLNRRYHLALRLAEIIWQATSPEHTPGSIVANGFLFNLEQIFEDFATTAIAEQLVARYGGISYPQYRCHLDRAGTLLMKPDLVWTLGGRVVAVVDAKYKLEMPRNDIYQMLAYCSALGLHRGHLIYAQGDGTPVRHIVPNAGVEIVCTRWTSTSRGLPCWHRWRGSSMS
jgi:5-methylcytosine-specific restriction enzyme subunit McrC